MSTLLCYYIIFNTSSAMHFINTLTVYTIHKVNISLIVNVICGYLLCNLETFNDTDLIRIREDKRKKLVCVC